MISGGVLHDAASV